jgi:hypothetical protein
VQRGVFANIISFTAKSWLDLVLSYIKLLLFPSSSPAGGVRYAKVRFQHFIQAAEPGATPVGSDASPSARTPTMTSAPALEHSQPAASDHEATPAGTPAHGPEQLLAAPESASTPALTSPPSSEPTPASVTAPTPAPESTVSPVVAPPPTTEATTPEPNAAPVASP